MATSTSTSTSSDKQDLHELLAQIEDMCRLMHSGVASVCIDQNVLGGCMTNGCPQDARLRLGLERLAEGLMIVTRFERSGKCPHPTVKERVEEWKQEWVLDDQNADADNVLIFVWFFCVWQGAHEEEEE